MSRAIAAIRRLATALAPLALCALVAWGVTGGPLSFGGGEKDILLLTPVAIWALVFALVSLLLWALGKPPGQAARVATVCGLLTLLVALGGLLLWGWR